MSNGGKGKSTALQEQLFRDQQHEKLLQSVWDLNFKDTNKLLGKNHIKYSEPLRKDATDGWNALFWALGPTFGPEGDTPERVKMVEKVCTIIKGIKGVPVTILDELDTSGKAAVHWAACQNLGECIKELSRHGANVSMMGNADMDGFTPMHSAVSVADANLDNSAAVRALIECGADANVEIGHGQYQGWTSLHCAVSRGRKNAVRELLRERGASFAVLQDVANEHPPSFARALVDEGNFSKEARNKILHCLQLVADALREQKARQLQMLTELPSDLGTARTAKRGRGEDPGGVGSSSGEQWRAAGGAGEQRQVRHRFEAPSSARPAPALPSRGQGQGAAGLDSGAVVHPWEDLGLEEGDGVLGDGLEAAPWGTLGGLEDSEMQWRHLGV